MYTVDSTVQPCVHDRGPDTTHTQVRLNFLNYGRGEDPAKRTYARMAFVERGLSPAIASANSSQARYMEAMAELLQCAGLWAAEQMQSSLSSGAHTITRQLRPASSSTRESNGQR